MRLGMATFEAVLTFGLWLGMGHAEIVDRIDVVVDNNQVIKDSDVLNEIRVTDFLNGAKLDLSLDAQKQAANRLIDQKIIRKAIDTLLYPAPDPAEADRLVEQIRQRFPNEEAYRRELAAYGITEDLLREHLLWQLTVLRFVSLRFQVAAGEGAPASNGDAVNEQFFAWLDQSRKDVRIEFKREDLQ
ncbi:MAG: hypothetical protein JWO19_3731 [Bryobacterales bacterium]|nr:hypothetical protein [Bryobacterales bacterium]